MYAFLLPHDTVLPSNLVLDSLNGYIQFNVVQSPPSPLSPPQSTNRDKIMEYRWILALIIIAGAIVIIATFIIIWLLRNMQKMKNKRRAAEEQNQVKQVHYESILSTPDAKMIADTFRQVMSTSELEVDKQRNQVGQDLLIRQLQSEG
jgi:heme/copper-type cytochrome/quinol oxidase subunit 2